MACLIIAAEYFIFKGYVCFIIENTLPLNTRFVPVLLLNLIKSSKEFVSLIVTGMYMFEIDINWMGGLLPIAILEF